MQHSVYDWQYYTEKTPRACRAYKNGCFWPRGKMIGGSHGINGMMYFRGNARDFNDWKSFGNPTWGWEDVLGYFRKSESNQNKEYVRYEGGTYHSDKGPLDVGDYHKMAESPSKMFIEAAKESGYDFVNDLNADKPLGYSIFQGTVRNGQRYSTFKSHVVPVKDRSNLHVIKNAHVTKVEINEDGIATGVRFIYKDSKELVANSRKEIVVSAGTINSPQLLMLSGVGPRKHLEELGISVKSDLPVGENLQDHLVVPVYFQIRKSTEPITTQQRLDEFYQYVMHRTGPLAGVGSANLAGLINTGNHTGYPDIETQHYNFKKDSPDLTAYMQTSEYQDFIAQTMLDANKEAEVAIVIVELLRPESAGRIQLKSTNAADHPKIYANYLENKEDVETLLRGVKFQAGFVHTKAFRDQEAVLIRVPLPECDVHAYQSDDYWRCYISFVSTTVFHPVGTNKMGPMTDNAAVVDSRLRVMGVDKLRVMDASVMPKMVSANTNAATIMIAEKGSDFIKEDWEFREKSEL